MHGIIEEDQYHLGLSYDPEGCQGSPKMLPASLIRLLSKLDNDVEWCYKYLI